MGTGRLRLRVGFQPLRTDDGTVVLHGWHRTLRISGSHAELAWQVLDALDGRRSSDDIADLVGHEPATVRALAARLQAAGAVEVSDAAVAGDADDSPALAAAIATQMPARDFAATLATRRVLLVGGDDLAGMLATALRTSGVMTVETTADTDRFGELVADDHWDGAVYAERHATYRRALEVDRLCAAKLIPWCGGWWEGRRVVVTHEMRFGRSACFSCLLFRQRANALHTDVDDVLGARLRAGTISTAGRFELEAGPVVDHIAVGLLALRCLSLLMAPAWSLRTNQISEFDLPTFEIVHSTVLRIPSCDACGSGRLPPRAAS